MRLKLGRRMWAAIAVVVAIGLFTAWYVGSPRWTLHQMKGAAAAGNSDKLAGYVDFPALRQSLKDQFKARAAREFTRPETEGFAAMGAAFAMALIDPMIDGLITPDGMRAMFAHEDAQSSKIETVDPNAPDLTIERDGLSRFSLRAAKKDNGGAMIFHRDGLGWKLAEMRLPAE